jgi:hypothetical protein
MITRKIADTLAAAFPEITIYTENITGGFVEPSFFVKQVKMILTPRLFDYQKQIYRYNITYFPKLVDSKEDMENMANELSEKIRMIDGVARLFDRDIEPLDNELHFSFALEVHVKPEEKEKIYQDLEVDGGLKHGE